MELEADTPIRAAGLLLVAALVTACSGGDGNRPSASDTATTQNLTSTAGTNTATDSGTAGTSTTTGGATGDVIFDFGPGTGMMTAGDGTDGCKKVDFLFVIDNSGSMADEQSNLVASFPGFISSIQTELADANGYHIGVVTSDAYIFNEPGCLQLGAMITGTGGANSSNKKCIPYAEGGAYMTEADNLESKFACAAQVGTNGSGNEKVMEAMSTALGPTMQGMGGCNEGFLRDDALLVITVITDEKDDHETDAEACGGTPQSGSAGEPMDWFNAVVDAKGGVESNVVALSLVGPEAPNACPLLDKCTDAIDGAEVTTRILQWTGMFTNGIVGQVCAPSYDSFFQEAVGLVKTACDDFIPPG